MKPLPSLPTPLAALLPLDRLFGASLHIEVDAGMNGDIDERILVAEFVGELGSERRHEVRSNLAIGRFRDDRELRRDRGGVFSRRDIAQFEHLAEDDIPTIRGARWVPSGGIIRGSLHKPRKKRRLWE